MYVLDSIPEIEDNVYCQIHHIDDLRKEFPEWDSYSKQKRMRLARTVEPVQTESSHNVTCTGFHEYIIDNIDTNQSVNDDASHLAVGDDDTSDPVASNTDLNNEVGRFSVTNTFDNGSSLDVSTFLDTSEANGNTLKEVGLVNQSSSTGDILFNHSLISDIVKTSEKTATIDVTLNVAFEGSTTAISVSDDGSEVVADVSDINFENGLTAEDDGDGTSTARYTHVDYNDLRDIF